MVTDFSGTSILSNEFLVITGKFPTTWGYIWVCVPNVANVATAQVVKSGSKNQNMNEMT